MSLNLMMNDDDELKPRITVFGVGGAGGNAVNNMIAKQLDGVEFVVANTDAQALQQSRATSRVQMGVKVTEGLGAGARPAVGAASAEESIEDIVDHLMGAHMCFITAGMGGGTGTGAAPIIAQAAREMGILTVGVVTKPFQFEGSKRMRQAEEGVEALQKVVDTLIIIPNQNLFRLANDRTTFTEAFAMADDVLYQGVKGVTDLMVRPGLINLDFADVRAVMDEMGKAMMGTGEAEGEDRAKEAAERAIANPLLDEISLKGAKGVLINITGGYDLTLFELDEAANVIREQVDPDANIIVGSTLDPDIDGSMRVSVVATGIDASREETDAPVQRRGMTEPLTQNPMGTQAARETADESVDPVPPRRESARAAGEATSRGAAQAEDTDVPAPAYSPERRAPERAVADTADYGDDTFIAPQPTAQRRSPDEVKDRLDRILNRTERDSAGGKRPSSAPAPQSARDAGDAAESPGRRLGKFIERMTGHGDASGKPVGGASIAERVNNRLASGAGALPRNRPVETNYDDLDDARADSQDKVEIPAFLRRQAN